MDFTLDDEQKALKQTVHEFAADEIRPISLELDEKGEFDCEIVRKAAKLELTFSGVPEEYGGPGLGMPENTIVIEELGWGCVGGSRLHRPQPDRRVPGGEVLPRRQDPADRGGDQPNPAPGAIGPAHRLIVPEDQWEV